MSQRKKNQNDDIELEGSGTVDDMPPEPEGPPLGDGEFVRHMEDQLSKTIDMIANADLKPGDPVGADGGIVQGAKDESEVPIRNRPAAPSPIDVSGNCQTCATGQFIRTIADDVITSCKRMLSWRTVATVEPDRAGIIQCLKTAEFNLKSGVNRGEPGAGLIMQLIANTAGKAIKNAVAFVSDAELPLPLSAVFNAMAGDLEGDTDAHDIG